MQVKKRKKGKKEDDIFEEYGITRVDRSYDELFSSQKLCSSCEGRFETPPKPV
ncbi:MAG: hypothetical protein HGN29_10270 [Asgard group archaeon]|nr:hypothetical protein [Asgard group archaeon]